MSGGELAYCVSVHYSFARSLQPALYCHGYSKFGSGPWGGGGGGVAGGELELYCDGHRKFGQGVIGPH